MTSTPYVETGGIETNLVESPERAPSFLSYDPRKILFAALALHFAVLSLAAILTQATLPLDVVEQISWARNPEWAYFKHPPLPAWFLAALMTLTDGKPWIAALAGPAATTLALWLVWLLARRILDPMRALLSVLILEGVVHFNALSPEFNHNIVQLPLWAFIAYASHRAIRENGIADWLLLGIAAALGMYGKYSTALLLISIAAYAMYDPTARRRLTEKGPWIAIVIAGVLFLPHAIQVYSVYDLYPLRFPLDRVKKAASFADHLLFPVGWLLAQLWFATFGDNPRRASLQGKGCKNRFAANGGEDAGPALYTVPVFRAFSPGRRDASFRWGALQGHVGLPHAEPGGPCSFCLSGGNSDY